MGGSLTSLSEMMRMSRQYQIPQLWVLRHRWPTLVVVLLACGEISPASAQVTYNIFPAIPPNSPAPIAQPTDHDAASDARRTGQYSRLCRRAI